MAVTLDIKNMTFEEKIMTMEALWDDLVQSANDIKKANKTETSILPDWHEDVLKERLVSAQEGKAEYSDWTEVKARLEKL